MKIAYSPCPNDTFVFHAWAHGLIPGAPQLDVTYADIDITNGLAASGEGPDILKISYAALPWVLENYRLLPCGGALGRGCGPLVLTAGSPSHSPSPSDPSDQSDLTDPSNQSGSSGSPIPSNMNYNLTAAGLVGKTVAVPSERSTAYLLFRLWAAQKIPGTMNIIVMPFDEIMPALQQGKIDAGLVIHEARFTYQNYGLELLEDLGNWWESDTGLPIPLGAIIARRSLDTDAIAGWIRQSVAYAWEHPEASKEYIAQHAQEMAPEVTRAHIQLYVNQYTSDLGEDGYEAVTALLARAAEEGLVPKIEQSLLF